MTMSTISTGAPLLRAMTPWHLLRHVETSLIRNGEGGRVLRALALHSARQSRNASYTAAWMLRLATASPIRNS